MWESSSIINLLNPPHEHLELMVVPRTLFSVFFMFWNSFVLKTGRVFCSEVLHVSRVSWGTVEFSVRLNLIGSSLFVSPGLLLCFSRLHSPSQLHGQAFPFIWCVFAVQRTMPRFSAGLQDLVRCCISGYHFIIAALFSDRHACTSSAAGSQNQQQLISTCCALYSSRGFVQLQWTIFQSFEYLIKVLFVSIFLSFWSPKIAGDCQTFSF